MKGRLPGQEPGRARLFYAVLALGECCCGLRKHALTFLKATTPFIEETQALQGWRHMFTTTMGNGPRPRRSYIFIVGLNDGRKPRLGADL